MLQWVLNRGHSSHFHDLAERMSKDLLRCMERVSEFWQRFHFPAACASLDLAHHLPVVHLGHQDLVDLCGYFLDYLVWEGPERNESEEPDLDSFLSSLDGG